MGADTQFERLEDAANHLVELLGQLRQENAELRARTQALVDQIEALRRDNERLQLVEAQLQEANQTREAVRGRVEALLAKLDSVEP